MAFARAINYMDLAKCKSLIKASGTLQLNDCPFGLKVSQQNTK